jgi:hypothetical protein
MINVPVDWSAIIDNAFRNFQRSLSETARAARPAQSPPGWCNSGVRHCSPTRLKPCGLSWIGCQIRHYEGRGVSLDIPIGRDSEMACHGHSLSAVGLSAPGRQCAGGGGPAGLVGTPWQCPAGPAPSANSERKPQHVITSHYMHYIAITVTCMHIT